MYFSCSYYIPLAILVLAAVLFCAFMVVRFIHIAKNPKGNIDLWNSSVLLLGLLCIAILTLSAFVIFGIPGIVPC